jgi:hypothetical protein
VEADGHVFVPEPVVDDPYQFPVLLRGHYDVGVLQPVLMPGEYLGVGPDPHQMIEVLVILRVNQRLEGLKYRRRLALLGRPYDDDVAALQRVRLGDERLLEGGVVGDPAQIPLNLLYREVEGVE